MRLFRHRRKLPFDTELDVTAFMNLMVVLVPFLLITAVFSQVSILELKLQGNEPISSSQPQGLGLEVRLFNAGNIQVNTRRKGIVATLKASSNVASELNALLQKVKNQVPSETAVTLLVEEAVPYEHIIGIMDAVRLTPVRVNGTIIRLALFPDVAIGSLPNHTNNGSTASVTHTLTKAGTPG